MILCTLQCSHVFPGGLSLETTSCQSGEFAKKILLKSLAGNIDNCNVFIQFLLYWERIEQLARAGCVAACDDEDAVEQGEELPGSTDDSARDEAMHACELGTLCPLFFMALHQSRLHHTAASTGGIRLGEIRGRYGFII